MIRHKITIIISALVASAGALAESPDAFDAFRDNRQLTERSDHDEIESFLREAKLVDRGPATIGDEHAYLGTMSNGRITRTVVVQTIRPYAYSWVESRDNYVYNVAAHKLDQLIGAGVVPCTVLRRLNGGWASVTIRNSYDDRNSVRQFGAPRAAVFGALVADTTGGFSGAFAETKALMGIDGSIDADDHFLSVLEGLTRKQLKQELGTLLSDNEIRFLLMRRDRIVARCRSQRRSESPDAD